MRFGKAWKANSRINSKHQHAITMSKKNVRTKKELAEDLKLICELRKKGLGWRTIGRKINSQRRYELSFSSYYQQYELAVSKAAKEANEDVEFNRIAEISELEWEIAELQDAWELSKGVQVKKTTKTGSDDSETLSQWEEYGDPRYMAEIIKRRDRLAKLQGLDAPRKLDHTTNGETLNDGIEAGEYSTEQLIMLVEILNNPEGKTKIEVG